MHLSWIRRCNKNTSYSIHVKSITGRAPCLDVCFLFALEPAAVLCSLFRDLALARINDGTADLCTDGSLSELKSSEEISMTVVLIAVGPWVGHIRDGELERVRRFTGRRFTGISFRILRGDPCRSEFDVCEGMPCKLVLVGLGMVSRPWILLGENTSSPLSNDIGNGVGILGISDVFNVGSSSSPDNDR